MEAYRQITCKQTSTFKEKSLLTLEFENDVLSFVDGWAKITLKTGNFTALRTGGTEMQSMEFIIILLKLESLPLINKPFPIAFAKY